VETIDQVRPTWPRRIVDPATVGALIGDGERHSVLGQPPVSIDHLAARAPDLRQH
jgi:hypothetical protein